MAVKGVAAELAKVKAKVLAEALAIAKNKAVALSTKLANATPVDTGNAKDGWEVVQKDKATFIVKNDVAYISSLNAGHSQQAPAFFIERVILEEKGLYPNGPLVRYREE